MTAAASGEIKDRKTGLVVFGILLALAGCFSALGAAAGAAGLAAGLFGPSDGLANARLR